MPMFRRCPTIGPSNTCTNPKRIGRGAIAGARIQSAKPKCGARLPVPANNTIGGVRHEQGRDGLGLCVCGTTWLFQFDDGRPENRPRDGHGAPSLRIRNHRAKRENTMNKEGSMTPHLVIEDRILTVAEMKADAKNPTMEEMFRKKHLSQVILTVGGKAQSGMNDSLRNWPVNKLWFDDRVCISNSEKVFLKNYMEKRKRDLPEPIPVPMSRCFLAKDMQMKTTTKIYPSSEEGVVMGAAVKKRKRAIIRPKKSNVPEWVCGFCGAVNRPNDPLSVCFTCGEQGCNQCVVVVQGHCKHMELE